jgi:hypothetical protein
MRRKPFKLSDIEAECRVDTDCYSVDGRTIGATVFVPPALYNRYPYNATAYGFLQQLRQPIYEFGTIEFPGLPVNKSNHTVAPATLKRCRTARSTPRTHRCTPRTKLACSIISSYSTADRDTQDLEQMQAFMAREGAKL